MAELIAARPAPRRISGPLPWLRRNLFSSVPNALASLPNADSVRDQVIKGDETIWEREPLQRLAAQGQLHAYKHDGFWQPMDTLREKNVLESLWTTGKAPWKTW